MQLGSAAHVALFPIQSIVSMIFSKAKRMQKGLLQYTRDKSHDHTMKSCDSRPLMHFHRNESHDQIERHRHTLSILETLYRLFQEGKLQEKTFLSLFKAVMPLWLDFLNSLRSEPGKMQVLQDQFRYDLAY